jgi:polyisoprenoid-binding protein YceI
MKTEALATTLATATLSGSGSQPTTYEIDPAHSSAQFKVRHLMVSNVRGNFSNVTGTVLYDPRNVANSKVQATIDTRTIDTRDAQRDTHLKSADFFDVEKFPTITFLSEKVEESAAGTLKVTGDLTIRGVTKQVVLEVDGVAPEVKDPWGNIKAGASATTHVNRQDFGLTWNAALETGGILVGDDVAITIEVELLKKK